MTKPAPKPPFASTRRALADALAEIDGLLPGSVVVRHMRCGKRGCACKADPPALHGPYIQWTRTVRGRTYHWPIDRRDPPEAKLHAKAVIIDSRDVLLTSAYMTSAAYDKNIELGVLCRGSGVASQVQRHFDALVARGVLARES